MQVAWRSEFFRVYGYVLKKRINYIFQPLLLRRLPWVLAHQNISRRTVLYFASNKVQSPWLAPNLQPLTHQLTVMVTSRTNASHLIRNMSHAKYCNTNYIFAGVKQSLSAICAIWSAVLPGLNSCAMHTGNRLSLLSKIGCC